MSHHEMIAMTEQGQSAELFKATYGGNVAWYFTSADQPVIFGGHTYIPQPMARSAFSLERSMKTVDVSITIPVTLAFGEHISRAPYRSTFIEIWKVFVASPDSTAKLMFIGKVENVSVSNFVATALCKSTNRTLSRRFPRIFYQTSCNHMIYDAGCGLSKQAHELVSVLHGIDGANLTLNDLTGFPTSAFQGGIIECDGEERLVTDQVGSAVTILLPFTGAKIGDTVRLYPGCDGNPGTCSGYQNSPNYFGMPYIPTRNPILWGFR